MSNLHPPYILLALFSIPIAAFAIVLYRLKDLLKSAKQINREATQASTLHRFNMATDDFEKAGYEFGFDSEQAERARKKAMDIFDELRKNRLV